MVCVMKQKSAAELESAEERCAATVIYPSLPVSIKMAKEQNLSLNPTKISGVCGRLMCCLKNEEEAYEELNSRLPHVEAM